jgi:hypothetical protein
MAKKQATAKTPHLPTTIYVTQELLPDGGFFFSATGYGINSDAADGTRVGTYQLVDAGVVRVTRTLVKD